MFSNPLILLNFYIYDSLASSIKKNLRIINEQFFCANIIKEVIYKNYLRLTPSYSVVILD